MAKVQTLFDLDMVDKRTTPGEQEFKEKNIALLKVFVDGVSHGFKRYNQGILPLIQANAMDKSMPAICVNSFIREFLINNVAWNCRIATKARFKLVSDNDCMILVKKLNSRLRPLNRKSKVNDLLLNQYAEKGEDNLGVVHFGYTTDKGYSEGQEVYALCIDGENILWRFEITRFLDSLGNSGLSTIKPKENKPTLKEGVIKIKKKQQDG